MRSYLLALALLTLAGCGHITARDCARFCAPDSVARRDDRACLCDLNQPTHGMWQGEMRDRPAWFPTWPKETPHA